MESTPTTLPYQNVQRDMERLHMEIINPDNGQVWQVMTGVNRADFDTLAITPPYAKVGIRHAAMDEGYFTRPPGAKTDGPLEVLDLFGFRWSYCARVASAPEPIGGSVGLRRIIVDKHHVVRYRSGRKLNFLVLPDGSRYVHLVMGSEPIMLPERWQLRSEELVSDLTIHLPNPTTTFFFANGDSYQGPV